QCLLWADPRIDPLLTKWKAPRLKQGGVFQKIADKKVHFFENLSAESSQKQISPPRNYRFFFSYSAPKPPEKETLEFLEKLSQKKQKALATFGRISVARAMLPIDLIGAVSGLVNFSRDTHLNMRPKWDTHNYLSKQMCLPGAIEDKESHLIFHQEGKASQFKTYEVLEDPSHWTFSHNFNLIGDFKTFSQHIFSPFYIHYGIYFPNQTRSEAHLKSKEKMLDHHLKFPAIRKMFPNMPKELDETLFVSKRLLEGDQFVQTRMTLGIWDDEKHILNTESALFSLYRKWGYKLQANDFLHLDELLRTLPMTWGESSTMKEAMMTRSMKTTMTSETGAFIPLVAEWKGNSLQGMPLLGRRGQLALWDPFETEGNLNTVVIGPSGQGKSVFMQDVIMNQLGQGGRVFVLDLGRSFEKLCYLLEGQYLFFNGDSNLNLNPFNFVNPQGSQDSINTALDMVASIVGTMAMPDRRIDKEKGDILSKAVRDAYDSKGPKATIDDVIDLVKQTTFTSELMKGASEALIEGLRKFSTSGTYSNYFYGENKIDFTSDFVVIETEELKNMKDLQAVILQIFALTISEEVFMGSREKRSLICIDEAWDLLKSPQMEGFIESMARRLRKYNGALMVGTQGLKDFKQSPGAAAVFQNSNWLVMVGRDDDAITTLKRESIIQMNDQIEMMLRGLHMVKGQYGEALIYNKGTGFYAHNQLKLDPFSALLYSTKAEEFQAVLNLKKQGYSIETAIEKVLQMKEEK
ncbi:MAG: type IV secretion system protein TraC, partial [Chlamydiia bacterium]|nr:type IV secretion system protein TraC [Chlamydiia bacterium]